jgi:hypothetical protein
MTWHAERGETAAGVSVAYTRVGETPATVYVVIGDSRSTALREGQSQPTVRLEYSDRDYLIAHDSLDTIGFAPPEIGDRITETINGESVTFEIRKQAGEPAWRWSDPERTTYRVHAKRV